MVTMLLEQRADVNHQDKGGTTALTSAAAAWYSMSGCSIEYDSMGLSWVIHLSVHGM